MIIVLMGVSGSGKTTIGRMLAEDRGWPFHDGDDFHPPENVDKMRRGIALDDADREGWLERLRALIEKLVAERRSAVIACSALKQSYRDRLNVDLTQVSFVYLRGDRDLIARRLEERRGHFMPRALLDSQLDALEEPGPDVPVVDVSASPEDIVRKIESALGLPPR